MTSAVRMPAVAGRFYPRDPDKLRKEIEGFTSSQAEPLPAIGCIAPHAGYIYSGHVAGALYSRIVVPDHVIVLCPNRTGIGHPLAIMTQTPWLTPLAELQPDADFATALLRRLPMLRDDPTAHHSEHAIEVQLPFLQIQNPKIRFTPIAVGMSDFTQLQALGEAMAGVISARSAKTLMVASSDMNHYESDAITRVKDHKAIDRVLALDARGLWETVINEDISMCGFGPAVAMLTAAVRLGAKKAELVKYATSGDVSGDYSAVVGYAGITVT